MVTLQRQIRVTSGGTVIDYGVIDIDVPKTLDADPPEGKVTFTNLSRLTEARFETKATIQVEAGQTRLQNVYNGQILRLEKKIQKPDTQFTIYMSQYVVDKETPISVSFENTTLLSIIFQLIGAMGLSAGNLDAVPLNEPIAAWAWEDTAARGLDDILPPYNLTWYIDEGRVHIASTDRYNTSLPKYLISSETGMVGSPEVTDTGVKVGVLLDTPVALNQLVDVESATYVYGYESGGEGLFRDTRGRQTYKVFGMTYRGNNWNRQLVNTLRLETLTS